VLFYWWNWKAHPCFQYVITSIDDGYLTV
jgi:hypothetical protein